jgi:antitoxin HicB
MQIRKRRAQQVAASAADKNGGAVGQRRARRETLPGARGGSGIERRKRQQLTLDYSMLIQWSDEDQAFVVILPEFGGCKTHGETYEEAAKHGQKVLQLLIQSAIEDGETLPVPSKFLQETP